MPKQITLIASSTEGSTGLSNYAKQLSKHLNLPVQHTRSFLPHLPLLDLNTIFTRTPLFLNMQKGIVHLTDQQLAFPLLYQKRNAVITVHDLIPLARNDDPLLRRLYYKTVFRGINHATHIIADSEHTKQDIQHHLNIPENKITVIPLGVDHNTYFPSHAEKDPATILYVGSEMPRKNIRSLITAFSIVKKEIPHAKLIKIGKPHWPRTRNQHKTLAKKLGIARDIQWIDHSDDLAWWYRKATAFCYPSLYEGFGLPILEAMACGTPVISSNRTSLPEIANDAALTCEPTPNNLAQHLISVLTDKKLAKKMSRKGITNAKQYSWKTCAEKTRAVYEKVQTQN